MSTTLSADFFWSGSSTASKLERQHRMDKQTVGNAHRRITTVLSF
jgi:hypothetical protein